MGKATGKTKSQLIGGAALPVNQSLIWTIAGHSEEAKFTSFRRDHRVCNASMCDEFNSSYLGVSMTAMGDLIGLLHIE
jgi:hypothetical protein